MPTIADLPIGAKLKFGAYSVSGETPHKICWVKAHRDGTILSEFIEEQCAFDVKEPDNPDEDCRTYGNNRCSLSNVQQFLNAEDYGWFHATHEYDRAPEARMTHNRQQGYNNKPGFLYYFESWEIDAIDETEVKTALPKRDILPDGEKHETFYAKVFMPSNNNMGAGGVNGVLEGDTWDLFERGASRVCRFSRELFENVQENKPEYVEEGWYYHLRSPRNNKSWSGCILYDGDDGASYPHDDSVGVRPALKLSPKAIISDEPDGDGYYVVLSAPQEIIEINEEEFFEILKKM